MTCKHQYFVTKDEQMFYPGTVRIMKEGKRLVCVNCSRIVVLYEDGEIEIRTEGKKTK